MSTKRKLIICRGIPASGKTTWAVEWLSQDPLYRARVNRDDIRWMVFNSGHGDNVDESIVTRIHNAALQQLMHEGRDIVVDNTNLYKSNVSYLKKVARENGYVVEFRDFIVTYEEALKRDRARPRPVGDDIVYSFFQRYTINGAGHLPKPPLN